MRQRDTRDLLDDIRRACDTITGWSSKHSYQEYVNDSFARGGVERQIEIIGEAMNRILKQEPGLSLRFSQIGDIIGMRNVIAHGYFMLRHEEVWDAIVKDVPKLRAEAEMILSERPPLTP
jgi:uncharacterized protein with HEPN domain